MGNDDTSDYLLSHLLKLGKEEFWSMVRYYLHLFKDPELEKRITTNRVWQVVEFLFRRWHL